MTNSRTNDNIFGGIGTFVFLEKTKQNLVDKKEGEFLDKKSFLGADLNLTIPDLISCNYSLFAYSRATATAKPFGF
jgi:hypothetical protein